MRAFWSTSSYTFVFQTVTFKIYNIVCTTWHLTSLNIYLSIWRVEATALKAFFHITGLTIPRNNQQLAWKFFEFNIIFLEINLLFLFFIILQFNYLCLLTYIIHTYIKQFTALCWRQHFCDCNQLSQVTFCCYPFKGWRHYPCSSSRLCHISQCSAQRQLVNSPVYTVPPPDARFHQR